MSDGENPICFVISAPSGAGKTTLADALLQRVDGLVRTISCTTRAPRPDEREGRDYFFVSHSEFEARRHQGGFLEWAEVHGNRYGTLVSEVDRIHGSGSDALLVIDVQGAESVRRRVGTAVTVFVLPPSRHELEERLVGRDGLTDENRDIIQRRLGIAAHEIAHYVGYDYVVVNDDLETTAAELESIVRAERCRTLRRTRLARAIGRSFEEEAPPEPQRSSNDIDWTRKRGVS